MGTTGIRLPKVRDVFQYAVTPQRNPIRNLAATNIGRRVAGRVVGRIAFYRKLAKYTMTILDSCREDVARLCRKYKVKSLYAFGSVLT
jgi:hypothetical protein